MINRCSDLHLTAAIADEPSLEVPCKFTNQDRSVWQRFRRLAGPETVCSEQIFSASVNILSVVASRCSALPKSAQRIPLFDNKGCVSHYLHPRNLPNT
jgi:hypothetical protein